MKETNQPDWLVDAQAARGVVAPDWVVWLWSRPLRRFFFAMVWVVAMSGLFVYAVVNEDRLVSSFWTTMVVLGAFACPLLLIAFGGTALQALADAATGQNRRPFFFTSMGWMQDTWSGRIFALLIVALTLVWWRSL